MRASRSFQRKIDFAHIRGAARLAARNLVPAILPGGKRLGNEWRALNPRRADNSIGSFAVNLTSGKWGDFATGDRGSDLIGLYAYICNIDASQAAITLATLLNISPYIGGK